MITLRNRSVRNSPPLSEITGGPCTRSKERRSPVRADDCGEALGAADQRDARLSGEAALAPSARDCADGAVNKGDLVGYRLPNCLMDDDTERSLGYLTTYYGTSRATTHIRARTSTPGRAMTLSGSPRTTSWPSAASCRCSCHHAARGPPAARHGRRPTSWQLLAAVGPDPGPRSLSRRRWTSEVGPADA